MVVALGLVLLFALVQAVAFMVLDGLDQSVAIVDGVVGAAGAMRLGFVQLAGIAVALALVVNGVSSWRGIGLGPEARIDGRGSGWRALLPVGLLVVGPSLAVALAQGDRLVSARIGAGEAVAFIVLAVLIAVNEELWFRGLVIERLGRALGTRGTIVISAVLFGLPHYAGTYATLLNATAVTLAVGVPFAAVRLRCGPLLPLIGWHAIIDIWAFLHTSSVVAQGSPSPAEIGVALVVPTAIALSYLAWATRHAPTPDGPGTA